MLYLNYLKVLLEGRINYAGGDDYGEHGAIGELGHHCTGTLWEDPCLVACTL